MAHEHAFPLSFEDEHGTQFQQGMTLRDWFASQAMKAALTGASAGSEDALDPMFATIARLSYRMADAMLAERSQAEGA